MEIKWRIVKPDPETGELWRSPCPDCNGEIVTKRINDQTVIEHDPPISTT